MCTVLRNIEWDKFQIFKNTTKLDKIIRNFNVFE